MTFLRPRLAAALTMTVAAATTSSLTLVGTTRADDAQNGTQSNSQSGLSRVPSTTLALVSSKSVGASSASAPTLTFVSGIGGQTKIFALSSGSSDAIPIKSDDWYGVIDGGKDANLPNGSDPRYPVRPGTAATANTSIEWLLQQLDDQGVNDTNVASYLGAHAHPDYIANVDKIIYKYCPKVIPNPEYSDTWITDENGLWGNQYVYSHLVNATNWAVDSYSATFIQRLQGFDTHVTLDDTDIQLIPFDNAECYKTQGMTDASLMGQGAKVTANGHTAFLASDLMSAESDWETPNDFEDRIADEVGEVDVLETGHHGAESSNSVLFMTKLRPGAIIQTGQADDSPGRLSSLVLHGDIQQFPMGDIWDSTEVPALACEFSADGITCDKIANSEWGYEYESETPRTWQLKAGHSAVTTGWYDGPSGRRYYFNDSALAVADQWLDIDGVSYHFDATGTLIEQKRADGTVTSVSGSSTPSPTRQWTISGGVLLVVLTGGVAFLRHWGRSSNHDKAVTCAAASFVSGVRGRRSRCCCATASFVFGARGRRSWRCCATASFVSGVRGRRPPTRSSHLSLRLGVIDLEARPGLTAAPEH